LKAPKISIVTVVFNADPTIAQCIESVLNQDYPHIEYIIVDGKSTDDTLRIVHSYQERIDVIISEKDKGLYDAMNKGIQAASGDFIGIVNADDFLASPYVISHLASLITSHPNAEAICSSVAIFKEDKWNKPWRIYDATRFKLWQFRLGIQPPHPGCYIKRECFSQYGNYNSKYRISGDFDILLRFLYVHRIKAIYTDFISVHMRDGGLSSMGLKSKIKMNNEDLDALKSQGIYSNKLMVWSKYLIKIFQLWRK
jgi:glycosyltransferase involved in cell wall biosynthesis